MVATVPRRLAHARRHAGALQGEHQLVSIVQFRPAADESIERILVPRPPRDIFERAICPLRMSRDIGQRAPFGVREAGDREPPILPGTGIDIVRRRRLVRGAVAVARPDAPVRGPVEDRGAADEKSHLGLRGIDPLSFARARPMEERGEHGEGEAVGAHPVEVGVTPTRGHRRLGQSRHLRQTGEGVRDRTHGAKAAVGALRAHARLLDVDDVRLDRTQHVVSQSPVIEHARRKTLRDDVRHRHQALRDLEALRVPDVERDAALAGILVVELPAHVRIGDALQRRRGLIARSAASERRHRGEPRIRVALELHLDALGAECAQEPRAAGRGEEPREVEDADPVQRERLAVRRERLVDRRTRIGIDHREVARPLEGHGRGVLVQQRRAPPDRPGRARRDPLARGVAERAADFRVLDVGATAARDPVRILGVFVGLPERRPQHAGFLCFAPRHVLVGESPHETLDGLHRVVAFARDGPGAGDEPATRRRRGVFAFKARLHAVALEQRRDPRSFIRLRSQARHHPAPVFRVHDRGVRRDRFTGMTAGLAQHRGAPHHPRHEIDLGGFRHRLVDRARQALSLARPEAKEQRGEDREGELLAGDVEGVPHLGGDRRQIVLAARCGIVAAIHHHAAERKVYQIRSLEIGPRSMVAERRHPRVDQGGELRHQRVRAQPARVEFTPGCRLQQHVRGGDERAEPLPVLRLTQVEHDRALAAVVLPEEERALGIFPVLVEGPDAACGAAAGRLHLDDLGAQTRQRQAAVLGLLVGQLDDADAGQCAASGRDGIGNGTLVLCCHIDPQSVNSDGYGETSKVVRFMLFSPGTTVAQLTLTTPCRKVAGYLPSLARCAGEGDPAD